MKRIPGIIGIITGALIIFFGVVMFEGGSLKIASKTFEIMSSKEPVNDLNFASLVMGGGSLLVLFSL
jgi:hypothetical protein